MLNYLCERYKDGAVIGGGEERARKRTKNPILLWFCAKGKKSLSLFSARAEVIIIDSKYQSFRELKDAGKGGRKEEAGGDSLQALRSVVPGIFRRWYVHSAAADNHYILRQEE